MVDKYFYLIEYHKNDVKMQEMSLERNEEVSVQNLLGWIPPDTLQARALCARVSAFGSKIPP